MSDHLWMVGDYGEGHRVDCPCGWNLPPWSRIIWSPKAAKRLGLMPAGRIEFATVSEAYRRRFERPRGRK